MAFLPTAWEGNVFRSVCLFTGKVCLWRGVWVRTRCISVGVTPGSLPPQGGGCASRGSTQPLHQYWHRVVATTAVGTYPTGMHSCLQLILCAFMCILTYYLFRQFLPLLPAILKFLGNFSLTAGQTFVIAGPLFIPPRTTTLRFFPRSSHTLLKTSYISQLFTVFHIVMPDESRKSVG